MNIDHTLTLAQLPQPSGRASEVYSAHVYSVSESGRRKRLEIALSVDGQATTIYSVSIKDFCKKFYL